MQYLRISALFTVLCLLVTKVPPISATSLNVTALTYRDNLSILQCWSLEPPFRIPQSGSGPVGAAVAALGTVTGNASFIVQGPNTRGGYRNAPAPQWSVLLSGLIHITLPSSPDEACISGGRYGIIFADDVNTTGHDTTFPSQDESVLLGIPFAGGGQPEHTILHEGACEWSDLIGI